ncbi:sensor histidine kinase [Subtercola boreus]|uniref:histidine kinase n=1 Tax=Subtercola boreus TaxID=120213 RepID=A0A3E0W8G5_9MICO|nr:HAMP domain-containing sensor histidine kinase [Subtercola boreus]RFA18093.1 hypothetical protein B7R24_15715 [Subtercola boreus]RFA18475.1 hypothetical protein B7R23_15750 [Subtercola boreus]RFA25003.1 hypothetical protein B7R25_15745 [Subtercola boreus]
MNRLRIGRQGNGARPIDDLRGASLRLTAQFTGLMLVVLLIVGGIVYALVSTRVSEAAENALTTTAQLDSPTDAPKNSYLTIVDGRSGDRILSTPGIPAGLLDPQALSTVTSTKTDVRSERTIDGHRYLLLTTSSTGDRNGDRVAQVAIDQKENTEELQRLVGALVLAGLIALVLAAGAAFVMAGRAMRPLADALALQRRFVADASHELRTPLTLLSTRAQLLRRRPQNDLPTDVTASVEEIVTDSKALTGILEDLLIAADPRSVAALETVDLTVAAAEAVALLADNASDHGLSLHQTGDSSSVLIDGSPSALLRLIIALLTNALDHADSAVTVSITASGRDALIRVTDDGEGFAPEAAANAFRRFASNRQATPEGTRHYGLGLAIVDEIARRHNGSVTIDSASTGGASVVASIPLQAS